MTTTQTIADLYASGRIRGAARLTGTITSARQHTTRSGHERLVLARDGVDTPRSEAP
ncbi:hypothetical protein ACFVXH_39630 [Kitasatospora sp. NPDC058184]|uniref:hypothetical protein n=1 Tax=Kitasatospora sp. NPDC058184 TaxID=3346370 RepID=UPI0036DE4C29